MLRIPCRAVIRLVAQGNRLTGSGIWVLPVPVPPTKMTLWASWVNWPEQKGSICACLTAAAL